MIRNYIAKEDWVSSANQTAFSNGLATQILAAAGTGQRYNITHFSANNHSATAALVFLLSGSRVIATIEAGANNGGQRFFEPPLTADSNAAVSFSALGAGTLYAMVGGFKSAV